MFHSQVTVLVAAQGAHKLPTINTTDNVKEALQYLADISSSKIKVSTGNLHMISKLLFGFTIDVTSKWILFFFFF